MISILISAVAIAYIIYNPVRVVTENVGPVSLRPGETRAVQINHQSSGAVDVEITNITADWAGLDEKRKEWTKKGRGNTPEVWFSVCSARESNECLATGAQRGINGTFRKVLPIGPASVTFVNFRDNPPIVLSARISY